MCHLTLVHSCLFSPIVLHFNEWTEHLIWSLCSDFGSIFSTLLPGTTAKLEPPEGCSFLDGLEVRVAFGGVWKQSLSELSGGQRSLLALSLILALLLFKPAPLYILDEVCSIFLTLKFDQDIMSFISDLGLQIWCRLAHPVYLLDDLCLCLT